MAKRHSLRMVLAVLTMIHFDAFALGIEEGLKGRPADSGLMLGYKALFVLTALIGGIMVSMTVVMPTIGAAVSGRLLSHDKDEPWVS